MNQGSFHYPFFAFHSGPVRGPRFISSERRQQDYYDPPLKLPYLVHNLTCAGRELPTIMLSRTSSQGLRIETWSYEALNDVDMRHSRRMYQER